jgi:hypothetical protein
MKRLMGLVLAASLLITLGGCVYGPGYYQRPGVVYDDGAGAGYSGAAVGYDDGYYAPGYAGYYGPYGYGYGYYGGPLIGLGFFGGYYGFHGNRGPWHGGWHGGGSHGGGSHGGSWHGGH